jgi:hypothetical protein
MNKKIIELSESFCDYFADKTMFRHPDFSDRPQLSGARYDIGQCQFWPGFFLEFNKMVMCRGRQSLRWKIGPDLEFHPYKS